MCAPSRSVLITGMYATETGVWHNGLGIKQDLQTLATELRKSGYTANYIGKWHMAPGIGGAGRRPRSSEARAVSRRL